MGEMIGQMADQEQGCIMSLSLSIRPITSQSHRHTYTIHTYLQLLKILGHLDSSHQGHTSMVGGRMVVGRGGRGLIQAKFGGYVGRGKESVCVCVGDGGWKWGVFECKVC